MHAFKDNAEMRSYLLEPERFARYIPIRGDGDPNPDFVIIKKQPSVWEIKPKRIFMGDDGLAVRKALVLEGFKFYSTSTFPFINPTEKVKLDTARLASPVISEELRRVGAKKFLVFGVDTARLLPNFGEPVKSLNDMLHRNIVQGDLTFRVVHAPNMIANTPALLREMIEAAHQLKGGEEGKAKLSPPASENYLVVTDRRMAEKVLGGLPELVACDVETDSLDPYTCRLLTIQFSGKMGLGYSIPWETLTPEEWASYLANRKLIFQNGSFDVKVLANNGVFVKIHEDTMLMHSLVDETPGTHSMEVMAKKYLNVNKWTEMVDYGRMAEEQPETLGRYGARDADLTYRLAAVFRPSVHKRYIHTLLTRAQNSILRSELRGVRIDRDKARKFQDEIAGHLHDSQQRMADLYGLENANSPKQVANLLYKDLGLPPQRYQGKVSTSSPALELIKDAHPAIRDIFEYRHLTKASGTYLRKILEESELDGRYHPEFRLAATETGRLAEKLIMLIPRSGIRDDLDLGQQYQVRLRELFIPDEGMLMVGADYSGLEVAMAAYLTGDAQLIRDINDQIDTHSVVAVQAFNLGIPLQPYETLKQRVSEHHGYQREIAKRGTFTWLYGGGRNTLAAQLNIDFNTAEAILSALQARYQGVASWQEAVQEAVQREGSITTPWGRTRRFLFHPGIPRKVHESQLREAINTPNQGMSSDMNLAAFTKLEESGYQTLFPFHDAVYLQVPEERADRASKAVKTVMETILDSPVPFRADVKVGTDWASLE
jgi:DNA polymerase I